MFSQEPYETNAKLLENQELIIKELAEIKKELCDLKTENTNLKRENEVLKRSLIELDQYGRRQNLRFLGIKEENNENAEQKIFDLIRNKLHITKSISIDVAHRVGKIQNPDRPRPIIVRFGLRRHAHEVLANRRQLKGQKGLTIVEDLCPHNAKIYTSARRSGKFSSVWTRNGKIMASTTQGKVIQIHQLIQNENAPITAQTPINPNTEIQQQQNNENDTSSLRPKPNAQSTPRTQYQQPITKYTIASSQIDTQYTQEPQQTM